MELCVSFIGVVEVACKGLESLDSQLQIYRIVLACARRGFTLLAMESCCSARYSRLSMRVLGGQREACAGSREVCFCQLFLQSHLLNPFLFMR